VLCAHGQQPGCYFRRKALACRLGRNAWLRFSELSHPVNQALERLGVLLLTARECFSDEALACHFPIPVLLACAVHYFKGIRFHVVEHFPISFVALSGFPFSL
jgi:hypothetical protein